MLTQPIKQGLKNGSSFHAAIWSSLSLDQQIWQAPERADAKGLIFCGLAKVQ